MTFWVLLVAGVAAAITYLPVWIEERREDANARDTGKAPGRVAHLSQGATYYRWHGPARGKVIVAIHGLTTPSIVWEMIAPGLGAIGYRVLTYDLYGRGRSDTVPGDEDRRFFLRQLEDLLKDQGLEEEQITLMGYSMGASISVAFAEEHPDRVARLILVAAAGVVMNESDFSRRCRSLPYVGDWIHTVFGARRMQAAIAADPAQSEIDGVKEAQTAETMRRGFLPAVLSSRRGMLNETQGDAHRKISREDIPVIALWGSDDDVIPLAALGELARWNRHARQEVIDGAGHGLPYTHGTAALGILKKMLTEAD